MTIKKRIGIKISLFSPEQVLNVSYGRVYNSKTLNYKNFKPELKGLFCDRVFGSSNEKCFCERTYSYDNFNFVCSHCGVETSIKGDNFKRYRLGHYQLNDFFINTLFYKSPPYYLSSILNLSKKNIKNILYDNYYLVFYSSLSFIDLYQILSFKEYSFYKKKYFNKFYAETGQKALYNFLKYIDVSREIKNIENSFKSNFNYSNLFYKKNIKRYKILKNLFNLNVNPLNIFLKNLVILPPDLRPIVKLPNETTVSSDLNELYKRIINSDIRLKKLNNFLGIPSFIISNEKKNLQNHIDNLFLGGGINNEKSLKSLSENLKGKTGFFRQNLLGKRVDYSGRAVIVSGANLKFGECAIPRIIAMELFRPFIYNKLLDDKNFNIKTAKFEVDKSSELAKSALSHVLKDSYVLLNRAPTLHRLGMQVFKILLTDDKAIKLHPLVCAAYNADFDGDQMAVHIPLSSKSKLEFRNLLFTVNNILYPSNGTCCIAPTQDIVLGLYYSTKLSHYQNNNFFFNSLSEAILAYNYGYINFNTLIFLRFKEFVKDDGNNNSNNNNNLIYKIYKTTLGRALIFNIFPLNYSYKYLNKNLKKEDISKILNFLSYKYDFNYISIICNNLMRLGFNFITKSGFSISIDDMIFSYRKKNILNVAKKALISYNIDYLNFFLTKNSKRKKILGLWDITCDLISNFIITDLSFSYYLDSKGIFLKNDSSNSLYMMMNSGARGSESQIKQICSNRGLISYKKHSILEIPVLSSLREGLNVLEYFYFSHNSRKTLADTALKTASAGYLTRRLVESSNNVFISEYDCGTSEGLLFKSLIYQGEVIEEFFDRIFGRILLEDFIFKDVFIKKNTLIDESTIFLFKKFNISSIKIRSPLKCVSKIGMCCCLCYGVDLSKAKLVNIGEMVGIIAAQAIGEPGTQLTMRTFHTGGAINKYIKKSFFKSNSQGLLKYSLSLKYVFNKYDFKIVTSKTGKIKIYNDFGDELEVFNIPYASYLLVNDNTYVKKGDLLCKWDSKYNLIISEYDGFIKFNNFLQNLNFVKKSDTDCYEIIKNKITPYISIYDDDNNLIKNYNLFPGYLVMFNDKDIIKKGDIIIKISVDFTIASDIVGGLPKIDNFFEARIPKNSAILAPIDGTIKFNFKKKKIVNIVDNNGNTLFSFIIKELEKLMVLEDQYINKGDIIVNGDINPHDILFIHGVDYLIDFLLKEIRYIYFSQGVKINDKHLEIIINQMLKIGVVISPGKTKFLPGEMILISDIENFNKNLYNFDKIKYEIVLTGITNKSLKNKSFLSAASFQKTISILSEAAITSNHDDMTLLKNVVMVGEVFIAGSGSYNKILNFY